MNDKFLWARHHFGTMVKVAWQRKGSLLRGLVRKKEKIRGKSTDFKLFGTASAGQKTAGGLVPITNPERGLVTCYIEGYYAGHWIDDSEIEQIASGDQGEARLQADAQAMALGRVVDDVIINRGFAKTPNQLGPAVEADTYVQASLSGPSGGDPAMLKHMVTGSNDMDGAGNTKKGLYLKDGRWVFNPNKNSGYQAHWSLGMTPLKIKRLSERFGYREVPMDGMRYLLLAEHQWSELSHFPEFANADYLPKNVIPYKGGEVQGKSVWGWNIFKFNALPITVGQNRWRLRSCFAFHSTAVGYASQLAVTGRSQYFATHDSTFHMQKVAMGAALIDPLGVEEILVVEDTELRPFINQPI